MPSIPEKNRTVYSLKGALRTPVPLTKYNFQLVQEPRGHSGTITVEFGESYLEEAWPPVDENWSGYWGGTAESRLLYLKRHHMLWAWVRESQVKRRAGFFTPKEQGGPRLRKIAACLDANNCTVEADATALPCQDLGIKKVFATIVGSALKQMWKRFIQVSWILNGFCLFVS